MISNLAENRYALSKTICFELIPQGMSPNQVEDFIQQIEESFLEDQARAEAYPKVKEYLDDYYRYYIEQVLPAVPLSGELFANAYSAYKEYLSKKDRVNRQKLENSKKVLRIKISKELTSRKGEFGLSKYEELFGNKNGLLFKWARNQVLSGKISQDAEDKMIDAIKSFERFVTYFKTFQKNRDNLFVNDKASSIAYRIIDENMIFYFDNCIQMEKIKQEHPELYVELEFQETYFVPENYGIYITQTKIENYNRMIGRSAEHKNITGVNQIINLYRQKYQIKPRKLPIFKQLYKQLLSVSEEFKIESVETDLELFEQIQKAIPIVDEYLYQLGIICQTSITDENADAIFVNPESYDKLSKRIYDQWYIIPNSVPASKQKEKKIIYSISELTQLVNGYIDTLDNNPPAKKSLVTYFQQIARISLAGLKTNLDAVLSLPALDKDRSIPPSDKLVGGIGYQQIQVIKEYMDAVMGIIDAYKPLSFKKSKDEEKEEALQDARMDGDFYTRFNESFDELSEFFRLYNMVRNYLTKKPYSKEKIKLNFQAPTFLAGWDVNREEANLNILFEKDGHYFLGVMPAKKNKLFSDSKKYICSEDVPHFRKMVYKQLAKSARDFPKKFFSAKYKNRYSPPADVLKMYKPGAEDIKNSSIENKNRWIEFMIASFRKTPDWNARFELKFNKPEEYANTAEFYADADAQMFSIDFENVSEKFIQDSIQSGKLYLFELYNKDFSSASKGKPNLHTLYWKALFSPENLENLKDPQKPVIKLNGGAELFFREKSLSYKNPTHPANQPIHRKQTNQENGASIFPYDVIKDRRFTMDKMFLHVPLTLNFRAGNIKAAQFNRNVNLAVRENHDLHLIGIDRGERNLLSYVVINRKGEIVEQGSLNRAGKPIMIDYQHLLKKKEVERDLARKSWGTIDQIKDLKTGYLSQIIYQLILLMDKYDGAVIVLEKLKPGFKRVRQKIETQVYQKFEKALIDKLNYVVFKDRDPELPGGVLNGNQLTAPFVSFDKIYRQTGYLYYVPAGYTSKICPRTRFVNFDHNKYESVEKTLTYLKGFNRFSYNKAEDYFEFEIDFKKIPGTKPVGRTVWTICTVGKDRVSYSKREGSKKINVTESLKNLFVNNQIEYSEGQDILPQLKKMQSVPFFKDLMKYIHLALQLRHSTSGTEMTDDYILSPVRDTEGAFYDSRSPRRNSAGLPIEPEDADTNGAFHIALKGLQMISHIDESGYIGKNNKELEEFLAGLQMPE